ncbi:MAG: ribbon-helix-helix protein, CopG family [Deltaproteobacteria bacterium]|nr:ribbon-helix-helix protein, CopG family [Deltaproteobacteria bacterium]
MKHHAQKSSFTLPASEIPLVTKLREELGLKSNTEVIRRALNELKEKINRDLLRRRIREASLLVRSSTQKEIKELDHLSGEGLDED